MRPIFFVLLIVIVSLPVMGQQNGENLKPVQLRSSVNDGIVRLRWAPVNPTFWTKGKTQGYIIEKITYRENGNQFFPPKEEILTKTPVLPAKEEVWIQKMEENDQVAIIAQAFFGKTFQLAAKNTTKRSVSILDATVDLNQRFAFSLMAADMNFEASSIAGWGYTDKNVAPDGIYKYRIFLNDTGHSSAKAEVTIDMTTPIKLPAPFGLNAQFDENLAKISWELSFTEKNYSAYNIERSSDNVHFQQLNTAPFIVTSNSESNDRPKRAEFNDSIPNEILYYYRVIGIDCFGEKGPYSAVVKGKAFSRLKSIPELKTYRYINKDFVKIGWDFNQNEENLISGFDILRAESIDSTYELIVELIPANIREFEISMKPSNYVVVRALGLNGDITVSGPQFIDQPDLTPPAPPQKPQGKIDSTGVVKLWWPANTEENLNGYHVYYSRLEGEEFVQLTYKPIADTTFTDSLSLNTLVEHINYRIRAVNNRNGHSDPSETLILELPDTIKPVSPYFLSNKVEADSVTFQWVNSGSRDVIMHKLFRKTKEEDTWNMVARYDSTKLNHYTDYNLKEREQYSYLLLAIDDDGLESNPSKPLTIWVPPYIKAEQVEDFNASLNRHDLRITLKWKKNESMEGFQLYKTEGEFPPFFYQYIDSKENKFIDTKIKPFVNYSYKIRSKGKNGMYSPFTEIQVNW